MNKFICIAFAIFALIASGSCSGRYSNLAQLALGSYGNPSSSSSSSSAAAAAPNSYASNYGSPSYQSGYPSAGASYAPSAAYAPAASYGAGYPSKAYGPKYSVQPAYATELYPGQQSYKAYNSPATYSQVALPIIPSAPVAKLYVPNQPAYSSNSYGSGY